MKQNNDIKDVYIKDIETVNALPNMAKEISQM
jgi:hypothetical protein